MTLKIPLSPEEEIFSGELERDRERCLETKREQRISDLNKHIISSRIISKDDYWAITGVEYRGEKKDYHLLKKLLPIFAQIKHAERRNEEIKNGGFYCADAPLHYSIFKSIFNSSDLEEKEEIREFLQKNMRDTSPLTLTRINYTPSGKDEVIHNFETAEQYSLDESIIGPDREIINKDSRSLGAILSTSNVDEVKQVLSWINQTPVLIERLNLKKYNSEERVVRFSADFNAIKIFCYGYILSPSLCFGVRLAEEGDSK